MTTNNNNMKELSIEEKAEAYDKAIERAKGLIDFCSDSELKTLEHVFPELKESEDERIKTFIRGLLLPHIADVHLEGDKLVHNKDIDNYRKALAWLNSLKPQPKQEWSEEDEDMLYKATAVINRLCAEGKEYVWSISTLNKLFYWLKSLKDRVVPQPKQEWSKEDRKMMQNIIDDIHCGTNFNPEVMSEANKREKWLKSICLRLQSKWKPSNDIQNIPVDEEKLRNDRRNSV